MSKPILYIDYLSQPSRAVLAFCIISKIPFEVQETGIISGQTNSKEFTEICPARTVPAMVHNGFALYESHAIMTYLASVFPIDDHWYPKDPVEQAKVNIYLHWHHLNIRFGCGHYLYKKIVRPLFSNQPFNKELEAEMLFIQKKSLHFIDDIMKNGKFVAGTDLPSIADISCYMEVGNLQLIEFDFSPFPNLVKWRETMRKIPGIAEANTRFDLNFSSPKL